MKKFILLLSIITIITANDGLLEVGKDAPSFVLSTSKGAREYLRVWNGWKLMKPYKNNVRHRVILSFWSTTCAPCMKEIPELHKFAKAHEKDSLKVFLINLDKDPMAEIDKFATEKGWTLPVLLDPYQNAAKRYGVKKIPTLFVLSPTGQIEYAFTGIPDGVTTDEYLEELIYAPKVENSDSLIVLQSPASTTKATSSQASKQAELTAKQASKQAVLTAKQASKQAVLTSKQAQIDSNKQAKQAMSPVKKEPIRKDTVKKEPVIMKAYDPNQSLTPDW